MTLLEQEHESHMGVCSSVFIYCRLYDDDVIVAAFYAFSLFGLVVGGCSGSHCSSCNSSSGCGSSVCLLAMF